MTENRPQMLEDDRAKEPGSRFVHRSGDIEQRLDRFRPRFCTVPIPATGPGCRIPGWSGGQRGIEV